MIRIPATSANLGVLFDKGGVALDAFYNSLDIAESDKTTIGISGLGSNSLPRDSRNLIYESIKFFYHQTGRRIPELEINTHNGIPLSRGLGSSAACIAGGIFAANELEGNILSQKDMILLSTEIEGHGDNVCAALTGGFSLFRGSDYVKIEAGDVGFILYVPKTTLSTKESRGVLPGSYDEDTLEKAALLEKDMTTALLEKDYEKAGSLMSRDVIHQPYRSRLLPYWDDVMKVSSEAGVWGTALSGAGPTMISMCSLEKMDNILEKVKSLVDKRYKLNIIGCEINPDGIVRG